MTRAITTSAPGRICLFGEHQDYLDLPVIAAAIDLRVSLRATPNREDFFRLYLPDTGEEALLPVSAERLEYAGVHDFFRGTYNVLLDEGYRWPHGWDCHISGRIPINAGASSSTALVLCWLQFLVEAAEKNRGPDPHTRASLAHRAEVIEFGGSGGTMDQFACSLGGVIHLDPRGRVVHALEPGLGNFVLGDSDQAKDTQGLLRKVRQTALEALAMICAAFPTFDLRKTTLDEAEPYLAKLPVVHHDILRANLVDFDLRKKGLELLSRNPIDHQLFGHLLTAHHQQLSRFKRISTSKIDSMLKVAMAAGALGGKINGSGGGGTMFAYAPEEPERVARAIKRAGGRAWIVNIDAGTSTDV